MATIPTPKKLVALQVVEVYREGEEETIRSLDIPIRDPNMVVFDLHINDYNIEIGAGLGPLAGKIWRFGLMGYSSQPTNVLLLLSALSAVLGEMGYRHDAGAAEAAAHHAYAVQHAAAGEQLKKNGR